MCKIIIFVVILYVLTTMSCKADSISSLSKLKDEGYICFHGVCTQHDKTCGYVPLSDGNRVDILKLSDVDVNRERSDTTVVSSGGARPPGAKAAKEIVAAFKSCVYFTCTPDCNCTCDTFLNKMTISVLDIVSSHGEDAAFYTKQEGDITSKCERRVQTDTSNGDICVNSSEDSRNVTISVEIDGRLIYEGLNEWRAGNNVLSRLFTPDSTAQSKFALGMIVDDGNCLRVMLNGVKFLIWCRSLCELTFSLNIEQLKLNVHPSNYNCDDKLSEFNLHSNICVKSYDLSSSNYELLDGKKCKFHRPCIHHAGGSNLMGECKEVIV